MIEIILIKYWYVAISLSMCALFTENYIPLFNLHFKRLRKKNLNIYQFKSKNENISHDLQTDR